MTDTEKWKARAQNIAHYILREVGRGQCWSHGHMPMCEDSTGKIAAALAEAAAEEREAYLIWSNDHMAWWRPNGAGYTIQLEKAGRYTRADAVARSRVRDQEPGKPLPEIPIRECDVLDILVPAPAAIRAREQKP